MRRRQLATNCALVAATGVALRTFHPHSFFRICTFFGSLASITYNSCLAVAGGIEITAVLLRDFGRYLKSSEEEEELPRSVVKMLNLLKSPEVMSTCQGFISTGVDGVMESQMAQKMFEKEEGKEGSVEKIISALLSEPGQNLVGLAVRMATKTTVETFSQSVDLKQHIQSSSIIEEVLEWLNTPRAQLLVHQTTTAAVVTGVKTFTNAPKDPNAKNPFSELLAALSQPQHAEVARQLLQVLVREAVTTSAVQMRNQQAYKLNLQKQTPRDRSGTLAVPDLQLVNNSDQNTVYNGEFSEDNQQVPVHQQITQGLTAIGSQREARDLVVSMASEVTGAGIRSMIFSVLDALRGRNEINEQLDSNGTTTYKSSVRPNSRLGTALLMSTMAALILHMSSICPELQTS